MINSNKVKSISNIADALTLKGHILESAEIAKSNILSLTSGSSAINLLYELKFKETGFEPLESKHINIIEQLNQLFTYLVSIEAVIHLIKLHPNKTFTLNLGTASGNDIESSDATIIAEVFSATSPKSNSKLEKDIIKVNSNLTALEKYVFYYSHNDSPRYVENLKTKYPGIEIFKVSFDEYSKNPL